MAATGFSGSTPGVKSILTTTVVANRRTPFLKDQPVGLMSGGAATVYGVNHPGDMSTTRFARFRQTISGNKAFQLPSTVNAPLQTVGGALAVADQLRVVVTVDGEPKYAARADQVAPAAGFVVGAGGGTAVGEANVRTDGAQAIGTTALSVKRTDAGTQTILVGDKLAIAGDSTVYRCTETSQALNGTTAVVVDITPPLQKATTDGLVLTVTTSDDRTVLLAEAPSVGSDVDVIVSAASDITQVSGGALTADRQYETPVFDYMTAGVALANIFRLHN